MASLCILVLLLIPFCDGAYEHSDFEWCKYEIFTTRVAWATAVDICSSGEKTLVSIGDEAEHDYLVSLLDHSVSLQWTDPHPKIDDFLWIGLNVNSMHSTNWLDCNEYSPQTEGVYQPADVGLNGCFLFDKSNPKDLKFKISECEAVAMFICEAKTLNKSTCFTPGIPNVVGYKSYTMIRGFHSGSVCSNSCTKQCYAYEYLNGVCHFFTAVYPKTLSLYTDQVQEKHLLRSHDNNELIQASVNPLMRCVTVTETENSLETTPLPQSITQDIPQLSANVEISTDSLMQYVTTTDNGLEATPSDLPQSIIQETATTPNLPLKTTQMNSRPLLTGEAATPTFGMSSSHRKITYRSSFSITTFCTNCLVKAYVWTLEKRSPSDKYESFAYSDASVNESTLVLQPHMFSPGNEVKIRVNMTIDTYGEISQIYYFFVNRPPYNGECQISPKTGLVGKTRFIISCSGWKDEGNNKYRVHNDTDKNIVYSLYIFDRIAIDPAIFSNSASARRNFTINGKSNVKSLLVRVTDGMGDYVDNYIPVNVTIEKPSDEKLATATNNYLNWANGSNDLVRVLEAGKTLITQWNNIKIQNVTNYIINIIPKEWTSGVLDVEGSCKNTFNYSQLLENVLQIPYDSNQDNAKKALESISTVMLKVTKAAEISSFRVVKLAADSFASVSFDSNRTSDTSVSNLAEVHRILTNIFMNLTNQDDKDLLTKTDAVKAMVNLTGALVNVIVPENLKDMYEILSTEKTKESRKYVDYMAFLNEKTAYPLMDCALMTPEERTGIYKLQAKVYRMLFKQKQALAERFVREIIASLKSIMQKFSTSTCLECKNIFKTPLVSTLVWRNTRRSIDNTKIILEKAEVLVNLADITKPDIVLSIASFKRNPLMIGGSAIAASLLSSDVVRVSLTDLQDAAIEMDSISVTLPVSVEISGTFNPQFTPEDASKCIYHVVMYRSETDSLCISLSPLGRTDVVAYEVYVRYGKYPTHLRFDIASDISQKNNWTACLKPHFNTGLVYVCLRPLLSSRNRISKRSAGSFVTNDAVTEPALTPYNLTVATSSCQMWDSRKEIWRVDNEKCKMKWLASQRKLSCTCTGVSGDLILGNSFYVPANSISFSNVFLKFSPKNQAAVLGVVTTILVMYIVLCLWARYQDKRDIVKWGVTPLIDNNVDDTYFYLITVYTGIRFGAGTNSSVEFVVVGSKRDSGVRSLFDGIRKDFSRGSVMHFIMATDHPLGHLDYIHLWLNQGDDGSIDPWYLHRIDVEDLQQNYRYVFLNNKWLADSSTPGSLETYIPVCGKEDVLSFQNLFHHSVFENLTDSHMFVSIFYRPTSSTFTRAQRVTSLFVFTVMTLIANAIYFTPADEFEDPEQFKLGPLIISLQTIYVSIVSSVISTTTVFLVVFLFRKSKPRYKEHDTKHSSLKYLFPGVENTFSGLLKHSKEVEKTLISKGMVQTDGTILPFWFIYIAWILSIFGSITAIFFLLLYSMEWGKQKSEMWLTQFFLSFTLTSLVLDQIKVVVMAVVFAWLLVPRNKFRPSPLTRRTVMSNYRQRFVAERTERNERKSGPKLSENERQRLMMDNRNKHKALNSIKEAIFSCLLMWLIATISYGNRNDNSFLIHKNVEGYLASPLTTNSSNTQKSLTVAKYTDWLNNVAFPLLYPELDGYDNALPWRWRQYFLDLCNYRVGPPRLRQVRVHEGVIKYPYLDRAQYYPHYKMDEEETEDHCIKWKNIPCDLFEETFSFSSDAWKYTKDTEIWGVPIAGHYNTYGGGGYIAEMDVNRDMTKKIMNELMKYRWFDRNTRAVFFEFTLYSADINMFTYAIFLAEFPETGGVISTYTIYPFRIYQHNGVNGINMLITEILFLIMEVVLLLKVCISINKERKQYFSSVARTLDFIIAVAGIISIVLYFVRLAMAVQTMEMFAKDPKAFVNFQHIVIVDFVFVLSLSILQLLVTLRLIGAMVFFKNVEKLFIVLKKSLKDLRWFGVVFWYFLIGFAFLASMMFGNQMGTYKSVLDALKTLVLSILGKSNFRQLEKMEPIMAKLFFIFFVFIQVYLLLTIFLTILCESIDTVSKKPSQLLNVFDVLLGLLSGFFQRKTRAVKRKPSFHKTFINLFEDIQDCCHEEMKKIKSSKAHQSRNQNSKAKKIKEGPKVNNSLKQRVNFSDVTVEINH